MVIEYFNFFSLRIIIALVLKHWKLGVTQSRNPDKVHIVSQF